MPQSPRPLLLAAGLVLLTLDSGAFGEPPIPRSRIVLIPRSVVASIPPETLTQLARFSPLSQFRLDQDNIVEALLTPGSRAHTSSRRAWRTSWEKRAAFSRPCRGQCRLSSRSCPPFQHPESRTHRTHLYLSRPDSSSRRARGSNAAPTTTFMSPHRVRRPLPCHAGSSACSRSSPRNG
jgi:hypothetical protein